ncbi:MAG TPA: hypothetical protein VIG57_06050 [Candidatus Entotheonella sp.]|jgi:hypothetical protein
MLSEALAASIEQIRRYQNDYPEVYREFNVEINSIVYAMESLMVVLDDVPLDAEQPESVENFANHEFRLKKVVDAIQSVMT